MKKHTYGFIQSTLNGTETILDNDNFKSLDLPSSYTYLPYMSPIKNQGKESTCVPHSISAVYDYYRAMNDESTTNEGKFTHAPFSIHQVYNCKTNKGDGMTYKEAFEFCKNNGVVSEESYSKRDLSNPVKILDYAIIPSLDIMKKSLIINGPCCIATYVRDPDRDDFWNGTKNYGGHATCIIGYDDKKEALLLRNSWGKDFGIGGYIWFPYKEYSKILEAWAVIA